MRTLAAALLIVATTHAAHADELHASAPRTIDFAAGIVLDGELAPGVESLPGLALDLRRFTNGPLWFGVGVSFEAGADLRNPERGRLTSMATTGITVGVHQSVTRRIEILAGLRLDGVRVDGWRMTQSNTEYGVRGGPQAGLAVMLGRAWGHPMSLEARASWLAYRIGDQQLGGWQAGLHVVGVLFPDRPRHP